MTVSTNMRQGYEFGNFRLDITGQTLWQAGEIVPLPPKVFDTLAILIERRGQVVAKDELLNRLWPDCFVEENSLTQLIFQARKALGETAATQHYIKTVPKRGYQFVGEVTVTTLAPEDAFNFVPATEAEFTFTTPGLETETVTEPIPVALPVKRPPWHWLVAAVVCAPFLGGWFFMRWSHRTTPISLHDLRLTRLTESGRALMPALSRDGRYVAYVEYDATDKAAIWVRQIATNSRVQVIAPAAQQIIGLTFAHNADFVYYVARPADSKQAKLHRVATLGGPSQEILNDVDSPISFAPDGERFAFVRNYPARGELALHVASLKGGDVQTLYVQIRNERYLLESPAWSPNGKTIVCVSASRNGDEGDYQLLAVTPAIGKAMPVGKHWNWIGQITWMDDSQSLVLNAWDRNAATIADQLWLVNLSQHSTQRITNDLLNYSSVSATANQLATARTERLTHLWLSSGRDATQGEANPARFGDTYSELLGMDWTRGNRLVYASQVSGNVDLWSMNPDGSDARPLTNTPAVETAPVAAHDGRTILYLAYETGNPLTTGDPHATPNLGTPHIWRMDLDGNNKRQLTQGNGERWPSLSPDGKWLIYAGEQNTIWKKRLDESSAPLRLTELPARQPQLSPDGQWVFCHLFNPLTKQMHLALLPFTGETAAIKYLDQMPAPHWNLVRWMPDSQALSFVQLRDGVANLWRQPLNGTAPQQLTQFKSDYLFRFTWSSTGQLACERGALLNDVVLFDGLR